MCSIFRIVVCIETLIQKPREKEFFFGIPICRCEGIFEHGVGGKYDMDWTGSR